MITPSLQYLAGMSISPDHPDVQRMQSTLPVCQEVASFLTESPRAPLLLSLMYSVITQTSHWDPLWEGEGKGLMGLSDITWSRATLKLQQTYDITLPFTVRTVFDPRSNVLVGTFWLLHLISITSSMEEALLRFFTSEALSPGAWVPANAQLFLDAVSYNYRTLTGETLTTFPRDIFQQTTLITSSYLSSLGNPT